MKLSIVIPAYNEEENIAGVIEQIEKDIPMPFDLVVINDHSTDKTQEVVLSLSKKYSNLMLVENNLSAGFANAIKTGFSSIKTEVVVLVMGDLCDDLKTVPLMFEKIEEGFDLVCASRYIQGGGRLGGSRIKGFLSSSAGRSLHYLLGIPTHDIANAFKMYRKSVLDSIYIEGDGFEISMELPLKAYYAGFKITEVPTVWREREKGKSSFKVAKLLPKYLRFYAWAIMKRLNFNPSGKIKREPVGCQRRK